MVPGIRNMIFGGDGLFLARDTIPGTVWLQTPPISRLAHQIYEYIPHNEGVPPRQPQQSAVACWVASSGRS